MGLIDKLKLSGAGLGLAGMLAVSGCIGFRQGDEQVVISGIPFIPVISAEHTKYKDEKSNEVEERLKITFSKFFGDVKLEVQEYGEDNVYRGKHILKLKERWGTFDLSEAVTEVYDANGNLIERVEGISDDFPVDINDYNP